MKFKLSESYFQLLDYEKVFYSTIKHDTKYEACVMAEGMG